MKQQNTLNIKAIILIIGFALIGLMLISNVSAYKHLCLGRGESVKRFTCNFDLCDICVTDNLYPTSPGYCYVMGGCTLLGGESTVDSEAPILTINSPLNDHVYKSKQVLFDVSANEKFTFYWRDNTVATSNMWRRVSAGMSAYKLGLNFKEGLNDITIKAMDRSGNVKEQVIKFYIDSKKPIIKKTLPSKGFTKGMFTIQFSEASPTFVVLNYGNDGVGIRTKSVDLNSCDLTKGVYTCNASVSVNDYNNQNIRYWFTVNDKGNNLVASKTLTLSVDTIDPVILNKDTMMKVNKTSVYFNLSVNENNFAGAYYMITSGTRPTWKTICTKTKNGICAKKDTLSKKGNYDIEIKVIDTAGNMIVEQKSFSII